MSSPGQKAYSYIRFSTPEQAKGDSLARQLKLSKDYAEKNGFTLDDSLSLRDLGQSGFKKDNITKGALGGFITAVEKGIVPRGSLLLVESLDRISRAEIIDQMSLFLKLIEAGITIVTLADGMSYAKQTINDQMSSLMYSLLVMSRGHEESAMKSRRLKSAWAAKRGNSSTHILTARCPAWLNLDKAAGKFVRIEDRCRIVVQIFEWAESGVGKGVIAKRLNESKTPVWGNGHGWHASYIQKILQNKAVVGEFQAHKMLDGKRVPEGEPVATYFPRIVSDDLFYRTLSRRRADAKFVGRSRTSTANLFSGLLKCGYSGASMVFINKGKWQYLVASDARRGLGGAYISWPYLQFETSFFAFLKELVFADLLDDQWKSKRDTLESNIQRETESRGTLEKSLERLVTAIAEGTLTTPPKAILDKITALESQIAVINKRLSGFIDEAERLQQVESDTKVTEHRTQSLLSRKEEPQAREQLRQELRRQISKIEIFAGGPQNGSRGFGDMLFANIGSETSVAAEDLLRSSELQEALISKFRKGINGQQTASNEIPLNRDLRFFKVHFKTGSIKHVMPSAADPEKIQRMMWTSQTKKGSLPDSMTVELADGMKFIATFKTPVQ